jgi:hypothetical protein
MRRSLSNHRNKSLSGFNATYTEMESVYGVQLLDDLHAYFPDVLYEPERFESVQDLLGYIQEQAQEHFNLYNRGRRLHTAARASPAAAAPRQARQAAPAEQTPQTPQETPAAAAAQPATATAPSQQTATLLPPVTPPPTVRMQRTPLYTSFYQDGVFPAPRGPLSSFLFDFGTEREDPSTQLLSSLLGLTFTGAGAGAGAIGGSRLASTFMDPVVVHPTREQIAAATEVAVLEEALEGTCAICQDRMEARNPVRKIRACNHSFHTECIDTWFERSVSCPVCRHDIRDLEPPTHAASQATNTNQETTDNADAEDID